VGEAEEVEKVREVEEVKKVKMHDDGELGRVLVKRVGR